MSLNNYRLKKIKGDASFRKFYRKSFNKKNSIIVYADKEKEKNLLVYDSINKILNKNNVKAPKLIKENYNLNYIEIEDLGKKTMFNFLKKKPKNFKYFKQAIDLLTKVQNIKDKKIKNFKNKIYSVPEYNKKILLEESELFCKWYIPSIFNKNKKEVFNKKLKIEIKKAITKLKLRNNTFVHRDFHVSNIMLNKNKISLIDNQDALIGNKAYDLASIIDDVRFKNDMNETSFTIDSSEGPYNTGKKYENGNMGHRPGIKGGYFPVPPVDSAQDMRAEMYKTRDRRSNRQIAFCH